MVVTVTNWPVVGRDTLLEAWAPSILGLAVRRTSISEVRTGHSGEASFSQMPT